MHWRGAVTSIFTLLILTFSGLCLGAQMMHLREQAQIEKIRSANERAAADEEFHKGIGMDFAAPEVKILPTQNDPVPVN